MKILLSENQFNLIIESISISKAKSYIQQPRSSVSEKYIDLFFKKLLDSYSDSFASKRKDRIYIPFKNNTLSQEISSEIEKYGMSLVSYSDGIIKDKYDRKINLGKVLNKIGRKDLLDKFNIDNRSNDYDGKQYIVISKHRYDIAGMSTDRKWDSCMNIHNGENKEHIYCDIGLGTLVVYLINDNDLNINNPICRVLLKPYFNHKQDIIYGVSRVYGDPPIGFKDRVEEIVENFNKFESFKYYLSSYLYNDNESPTKVYKGQLPVTVFLSDPKWHDYLDEYLMSFQEKDKVILELLSEKKFLEKLDFKNITILISFSNDPQIVVKKLGKLWEHYVYSIDSYDMHQLILKSKNPSKIFGILGKKGEQIINELTPYRLISLVKNSDYPDALISHLLSYESVKVQFDQSDILDLIIYSTYPEKIIEQFGDRGIEFIRTLTPSNFRILINSSSVPEKIKSLIKKYKNA